MKKIEIHRIWVLFLLGLMSCIQVKAQYMPVVFDKQYGEGNQIETVCPLSGDGAALLIKEGTRYNLTRIGREGDVIFSLALVGFTEVNAISPMDGDKIMIVGQSSVKNSRKYRNITLSGRLLIVDGKGAVDTDICTGNQGSTFMKGELLKNGAIVLAGSEPKNANERQGILMKVDKSGKTLYNYVNVGSGYCNHFAVLGHTTEYICAAFSGDRKGEKAAVVRLDNKGKVYYVTTIPAAGYTVTGIHANLNEGNVIVSGNSLTDGGIVYKIRPEGDIVYGKTIIPAGGKLAALDYLNVARNGNIFVGGNGEKGGYYSLLRNDGTSLYTGNADGALRGMGMNTVTGEAVVTTFNAKAQRGSFVRIHPTGKAEFDRTVNGDFDKVKINNSGEVMLMSAKEGRVCMYSPKGAKEFDRYITDNKPAVYRKSFTTVSGELFFLGKGSRILKLGHGLYVSDVKITKPVNGTATAVFAVTLTGYALTKEGAPIPVSVDYATREVTANTENNFVPVKGKLSFTPSRGVADRYLVKQEIEVPVKANNLIEGLKKFELLLSGVQNSYIVKPVGNCLIEDQRAVVKLIRTEEGREGEKDILYEVGLFKTDGTALTNATGANVIVDGTYGEGSADALDFDMGLTPRAVFASGSHSTTFSAKTLEDTRYELPKTVVVNFDKVYSLSGTNIGFNGDVLSCTGIVKDQPAKLAISSLGDHRLNHNVVSGFFTISLLRASDGALLTNTTGTDIFVECTVLPDATAKENRDFVITNLHDLRIGGDANHGTVNVNGVVLYSTDKSEKQVKLKIKSVKHPAGALPVGISETEHTADFMIRK